MNRGEKMYSLPHSIDMEKSVLGCILTDKQEYIPKLSEDDFHDTTCKTVFQACKSLFDSKKTIDSITVSDLLKGQVTLTEITDLVLFPSTPENIEYYWKQLKEYSAKRGLIKAANRITQLVYEGQDSVFELKAKALKEIDVKVYEENKKDFGLSSIMVTVLDDIEKKYNEKHEEKLFTGFYDIDKITAGLHNEEMTIYSRLYHSSETHSRCSLC
jgi:replicative DNA helicase